MFIIFFKLFKCSKMSYQRDVELEIKYVDFFLLCKRSLQLLCHLDRSYLLENNL